MDKKYISLREVGRQLDVPPSTIVYYKDKFEKYIPSVGGEGRRSRYPVEVLEIFRRIRKMFNDNWSTEQIERELALKFSVLMDDQQSDQQIDQSVSAKDFRGIAGVLSKMSDVLENQSLFRSEIRSLRDEVADLRRERKESESRYLERVAGLEKDIVKLKRSAPGEGRMVALISLLLIFWSVLWLLPQKVSILVFKGKVKNIFRLKILFFLLSARCRIPWWSKLRGGGRTGTGCLLFELKIPRKCVSKILFWSPRRL